MVYQNLTLACTPCARRAATRIKRVLLLWCNSSRYGRLPGIPHAVMLYQVLRSVDFLNFVFFFLPQRAPLPSPWLFRAPTSTTPSFYYLPVSLFPFFSFVLRRALFFQSLFFCGPFFNMYELVVVEHLQQTHHNKAQSAMYVLTRARQRNQADIIGES